MGASEESAKIRSENELTLNQRNQRITQLESENQLLRQKVETHTHTHTTTTVDNSAELEALNTRYNTLLQENNIYMRKNSELIHQIDDFKKETINIKMEIEAKFLSVIEKIKIEYENKL